VSLFPQFEVIYAALEHALDVRPTGTATNKVEPLITLEGIDQRILVGNQRIARGRGAAPGDIGDTGDQPEYGARRAAGRHHEVREEQTFATGLVDMRSGARRVTKQPGAICAE